MLHIFINLIDILLINNSALQYIYQRGNKYSKAIYINYNPCVQTQKISGHNSEQNISYLFLLHYPKAGMIWLDMNLSK